MAVAEAAESKVALGIDKVALLTVAVPVAAPKLRAVAAPPTFTVVALVLKRLPVPAVVESVPQLTATAPEVVILPFEPVIEKLVAVTLVAPNESEVSMVDEDRSRAVWTCPPVVPRTLIAVGRARSASWF